ncbi:transcriptional regulator [Terriglobus roseus DSM 18391]|uniref:Transcriptional regulator n=1 Tax=Terriglobus roseus (strain DSM 18391 / NRRL B-41598 / KBS 63) TaxID=926566 RepID=I3ZH60_TERRK|nr:Lrp/AsnC family transcriptional regulator [Terriglobus roseus]AFL88578.1 transcriptional regulator [Terriglobus roseus DSM 18391]AFL88918.1 transcriptional regulator [Terriglobus roseus DSM 18391]
MPTNVRPKTAAKKIAKAAEASHVPPLTPAPALLDAIDHALIEELQDNARISFAELARRVHLSKPAVMERVRRLETSGVILRYRTEIDPAKLGLAVRAFVKITVAGDRLSNFARLARSIPEVVECHRVTGNESFLVQVVVRDMNHLETVIDALMPYVATNTSMVLNSPVQSARIPLPAPQPKRGGRR